MIDDLQSRPTYVFYWPAFHWCSTPSCTSCKSNRLSVVRAGFQSSKPSETKCVTSSSLNCVHLSAYKQYAGSSSSSCNPTMAESSVILFWSLVQIDRYPGSVYCIIFGPKFNFLIQQLKGRDCRISLDEVAYISVTFETSVTLVSLCLPD